MPRLLLLAEVLQKLPRTSNLLFAKQLLSYISKNYLDYSVSQDGARWWDTDRSRIGAVAHLLHALYQQQKLSDILTEVIKNSSSLNTLPIQRASILAVSAIGSKHLDGLTEYFLALWGDKGYITHTPISAQERSYQPCTANLRLYAASSTLSLSFFSCQA